MVLCGTVEKTGEEEERGRSRLVENVPDGCSLKTQHTWFSDCLLRGPT